MPEVPSGILYFSVWKYLLLGFILTVPTLIFRSYGIFDSNPMGGFGFILALFALTLGWLEYGDAKLFKQWRIDRERTNCDRLMKAALYVFCCAAWPKFVAGNET